MSPSGENDSTAKNGSKHAIPTLLRKGVPIPAKEYLYTVGNNLEQLRFAPQLVLDLWARATRINCGQ